MESAGPADRHSTMALLVLLGPACRRRTHHDYAHYLGEIAGRHLAGV